MEIEEAEARLEASEAHRAEVDEFLARARATIAHTREVIQATRERLGPPPGKPSCPRTRAESTRVRSFSPMVSF